MTWLVASVAVETSIPPAELIGPMDDETREYVLGAMVAYLQWRAAQRRKQVKRGRS